LERDPFTTWLSAAADSGKQISVDFHNQHHSANMANRSKNKLSHYFRPEL